MSRILLFVLLLPLPLFAQGYTPTEALKKMQLPKDFSARLVASEPMIRQPLSMSFDGKGRLWVLQYLQYPNPAGLKALKQDQYLRTIWDKVPEPPPHGPKGIDRITILSDPDEHGVYRKSKDFLNNLNLATGFCLGNGGVYVLQSPYLLFYPDRNHDDVPDGDPEVLLKGFGMEDTHSYANSLQWGPDGWLYGAHGSTVTANIRGIEFQQGIWRYHPRTKEFELFSEGGGNTYGLDFDRFGRAIAGTNWGGKAMLHQFQGAWYVKGFSKHGPLHNPHSYGYFDHVPYENFKGGHVTCGGVVYQADAYPKEFHDQYIAGNLLSNAIYWHRLIPTGASYTAKHGGDLLVANDTWFRPVDCFLGPDGSVYVADWYDKRAAHLDPLDTWDKTNGRIWRIEYQGTPWPKAFDLDQQSTPELVKLLKHSNKWWRNEARRILAERRDPVAIKLLLPVVENQSGVDALEALWAISVSGGFNPELAGKLLHHSDEHVRTWTVRLLGDTKSIPEALQKSILELAAGDSSLIVRNQLACTACRLTDSPLALKISLELAERNSDAADPYQPLLIWWAIERHALPVNADFVKAITERKSWESLIFRQSLAERLARRWMSEATPESQNAVAALLDSAPDTNAVLTVTQGLNLALERKSLDKLTPRIKNSVQTRREQNPQELAFLRLAVKFGLEDAFTQLLQRMSDDKEPPTRRIQFIEWVSESGRPEGLAPLLTIFQNSKNSDPLRSAALTGLGRYPAPEIPKTVLALFPELRGELRKQALSYLLARVESAKAVLGFAETGKIDPKEIPLELLRTTLGFRDNDIDRIVLKLYGKIGPATPGEKQARITWLGVILSRGSGDIENGHRLFTRNCAVCHNLFGEGGKVGPDLTTADRKNRGYMLANIVDPSGYIRPEYMVHNVSMLDGRKLSGIIENSAESLTLVNVTGTEVRRTPIPKKDVEDLVPSAVSLMPEKLLDTLSDQEVRDLFAWLGSDPAKQTPKIEPKKEPSPRETPKKKLKVLLISGSLEYKSDESLSAFQKILEANHPIECVRAFRKTDDEIPGLEALDTCDLAIFFTRRLTLKGESLDRIKKYALSGKPLIGLRTASHGFQNWLEMDAEVFGGNYKGHFGQNLTCEVKIDPKAADHMLLKGVKPFTTKGGLYKNQGIASDVTVLLTGIIPNQTEPVAWFRTIRGGRVFYTSLGHPDDFSDPNFQRLLTNAIQWVTEPKR